MLIVEYTQKGGCSFADGEVLDVVRSDWAEARHRAATEKAGLGHDIGLDGTYRRDVSSVLYIDALRMLIGRGEIDPKGVTLLYRRKPEPGSLSHSLNKDVVFHITIDNGGRLDNWPEGFCDVHEEFLTELAGWK